MQKEPFDPEFLAYLRNRAGGAVDPTRCSDDVLAELSAEWRAAKT